MSTHPRLASGGESRLVRGGQEGRPSRRAGRSFLLVREKVEHGQSQIRHAMELDLKRIVGGELTSSLWILCGLGVEIARLFSW